MKNLHKIDLDNNYNGVFMPGLLENKYKNSAREFSWQFFFPAKELTKIPATQNYRRYHLHETHVQKAVKGTAIDAQIPKKASPHTCRHSFAQPGTAWSKTFGGTEMDIAYDIKKTSDDGYIIVGHTSSFDEGGIWLLKTDVPSGVYYYTLKAGLFSDTKRMIVVQ